MEQVSARSTRIAAPDLARGYMLLLIALANVPVFAAATIFSENEVNTDGLSRAMEALSVLFADGRAYPLFSMLFGFGLAMLTAAKLRAGYTPGEVRGYLAIRMLWLLAIGAVHGIFFPGDIIGAYALTGLIAAFLVLAPAWVVWLVTGISGFVWLVGNVGTMVAMGMADIMSPSAAGGGGEILARFGYNPLINLGGWFLGSIGTALMASLPLVLVGLMLGRSGWLSLTPQTVNRMRLVAAGCLTLGLLSGLPGAAAHLGLIGNGGWWVGLARTVGPVMALGYLAAAALIGYRWSTRQGGPGLVGRWMEETGRRSMTSYLLQTVLFILLLAPYGPLGLSEQLSSGQERLFALGVWAVTVLVAVLLARAGKPGPADALLRRLSNRRERKAAAGTRPVGPDEQRVASETPPSVPS